MSASLFDSFTYSYAPTPTNYLDHNEGDKTFGELKAGDIIYYHNFDSNEILDIAVKTGKISHRDDMAYVSIKPTIVSRFQKLTRLEFGPTRGGRWFNNGKEYSCYNIPTSSLCVDANGAFVFGTNREVVLAVAKLNMVSRIEEVKKEIEGLNKKLNGLTTQFDSLI